MSSTQSDDVVAKALAEVAKARAFRERTIELRQQSFSRIPQRTPVYVLSGKAQQKDQKPCSH